jgi:hypothetical protein
MKLEDSFRSTAWELRRESARRSEESFWVSEREILRVNFLPFRWVSNFY